MPRPLAQPSPGLKISSHTNSTKEPSKSHPACMFHLTTLAFACLEPSSTEHLPQSRRSDPELACQLHCITQVDNIVAEHCSSSRLSINLGSPSASDCGEFFVSFLLFLVGAVHPGSLTAAWPCSDFSSEVTSYRALGQDLYSHHRLPPLFSPPHTTTSRALPPTLAVMSAPCCKLG